MKLAEKSISLLGAISKYGSFMTIISRSKELLDIVKGID
jgi:hypothetical protein